MKAQLALLAFFTVCFFLHFFASNALGIISDGDLARCQVYGTLGFLHGISAVYLVKWVTK